MDAIKINNAETCVVEKKKNFVFDRAESCILQKGTRARGGGERSGHFTREERAPFISTGCGA